MSEQERPCAVFRSIIRKDLELLGDAPGTVGQRQEFVYCYCKLID